MTVTGLAAVLCTLAAMLPGADAALRPVGPPGNGIHGVVTSGGCTGASGSDVTCHEGPARAEVRVLRQRDHSEVTRFHSRKRDGRFEVALSPGRYVLDPLEGRAGTFKGVIHVHVRKHTWVRVEIHYDNGEL